MASERNSRKARSALRLTVVGLLSAVLLACSSDDPISAGLVCPDAVIVADAARLVKFQGTGRDLTDVLFEAEVDDVNIACTYDDDENAIEAELQVLLLANRGPADQGRQAQFRYFVAIATSNRAVLAREEFDLAIPFEGNRTRVAIAEQLEPRIPLAPGQTGGEYRVFVGLSLTPEELDYNRRNR